MNPTTKRKKKKKNIPPPTPTPAFGLGLVAILFYNFLLFFFFLFLVVIARSFCRKEPLWLLWLSLSLSKPKPGLSHNPTCVPPGKPSWAKAQLHQPVATQSYEKKEKKGEGAMARHLSSRAEFLLKFFFTLSTQNKNSVSFEWSN